MSVRAVSRFFGLGLDNWVPEGVEIPASTMIQIDGNGHDEHYALAKAVIATYNIDNDDGKLRQNPGLFEKLRGDYPVRREFGTYTIEAKNIQIETIEKLKNLGFRVKLV